MADPETLRTGTEMGILLSWSGKFPGERRTYATVACGEADGYTGIFEDPENFWR